MIDPDNKLSHFSRLKSQSQPWEFKFRSRLTQ
jgi:hypothetical protein